MGYIGLVGMAITFGLGVVMIALSFVLPKSTGAVITETEAGGLSRSFIAEGRILQGILADLSRRIRPTSGDLETDLRKSGYVYKSLAEYHARRMYGALLFVGVGIVMGVAMNLGPMSTAVLATLAAGVGFVQPDTGIRNALDKRRKRIVLEMTYGLDRIALFLTSDAKLSEALQSVENMGLFGKICSRMAADIEVNRPFSEIVSKARNDVPHTPELEEFLRLVQDNIGKGFTLKEPLQDRADTLRERLENAIVVAGGLAKIRVLLISAGFIMAASLLVTIGPTLAMLAASGVF